MVEAAPTTHATHDPLLVAALVDRDLAGPELDRARAQVADCSACAELHADLLSLAAATRALPTPARPRDFTLTETDVARLRPGLVRRLLGAIGSSRDAFSRPLAAGLTTLGLAGLLVATVPTVLPVGESGAAGAPGAQVDAAASELYAIEAAPSGEEAVRSAASAAPAPAAPPDAGGGLEEPAAQGDGGSSDLAGDDAQVDAESNLLSAQPPTVNALVVVSGSLLVIGLGLFALRWTARRFGD